MFRLLHPLVPLQSPDDTDRTHFRLALHALLHQLRTFPLPSLAGRRSGVMPEEG